MRSGAREASPKQAAEAEPAAAKGERGGMRSDSVLAVAG